MLDKVIIYKDPKETQVSTIIDIGAGQDKTSASSAKVSWCGRKVEQLNDASDLKVKKVKNHSPTGI